MATFVLIAWPLLTLVLVLRLPFPSAVAISIIGGFLLLPTRGGIDLPLLPTFDKETIPALTLVALAFLVPRRQNWTGDAQAGGGALEQPGWIPQSAIARAALLMLVLGAQMTALTNTDRLVYGPTVLPPMSVYDGFSLTLTGLTAIVPLLLGRKFFAHPESQAILLRYLVVAGLAYSVLALYEVRMSPQLNRMFYGYFPHNWGQHVRGGGWRPVVFMYHGLQLAMFFAAVSLAAFGAARTLAPKRRAAYFLAGVWLLGTLALSNSLGALIIAVAFVPVVLFLIPRTQLLVAAVVAAIVLTYPLLRSIDVVPTDRVVAMIDRFEPERARSLNFRVRNEDLLLEHAMERPLFGWGRWNRNRVYDEEGRDVVVTDGMWVGAIGVGGWIGYLAYFGLLTMPIILLAAFRKRHEVAPVSILLALILAAFLVDLIPNGFPSQISLLMAGALWGRLELRSTIPSEARPEASSAPQYPAYGRSNMSGRASGSDEPASDTREETFAYTRQKMRNRRLRHRH